jgi:hypothetical protein
MDDYATQLRSDYLSVLRKRKAQEKRGEARAMREIAELELGFLKNLGGRAERPQEPPALPMSSEVLKFAESLGQMATAVARTGRLEARVRELASERESLRRELRALREREPVVDLGQSRRDRLPEESAATEATITRDHVGRAVAVTVNGQQLEVRRERRGTRIEGLARPGSKMLFARALRDDAGTLTGVQIIP